MERKPENEAQAMEALIHIQTVEEEHIQPNPDAVDPSRCRQRSAMRLQVDVAPAEDRRERGCPDHHVEEPTRQLGCLEVRCHVVWVGVEESGKRLHCKQVY